MILHYIRISLRNLIKYKVQTAISIVSIAVSLTLMAVVAGFLLSIKPTPLFNQPFADRIMQLSHGQDVFSAQSITGEEISLILGHRFNGVEAIHYTNFGNYGIFITANSGQDNERSLYSESLVADSAFLTFHGMKSIYSGKTIGSIADNETVLTDKMAKKIFGKENPIGKSVYVNYGYYDDAPLEKTYTVKDVMENPSPNHRFIGLRDGIIAAENQIPKQRYFECYFVLKDGASPDDLTQELKNLLSANKINLINVKDFYTEKKSISVRNGIILFLFLFVLVSFSNYLRQQTQLFRLREREIALRTCMGGVPGSLFSLFATEISIVMLITLILTLTLISFISGFLVTNYTMLFEDENYSLTDAVPVALVSTGIIIAISLLDVALTVKRIRNDQTVLALRIKPVPKHRIRNIGLTVQMTVSIIFTCIALLLLMSVKSIKEYCGIPEDQDRYKSYILLSFNGISSDMSEKIWNRINSLESVARTYKFMKYMTGMVFDEGTNDYTTVTRIFQNGMDAVDLFKLKIEDINIKVNPDKYVLISKTYKQTLIDKNCWNGKTVEVKGHGEYEVKGIFDKLPFTSAENRNTVVVYDVAQPYMASYDCIVHPKSEMVNKAFQEINELIKEVAPARIDLKADSYYKAIADNYIVMNTMLTIIYILSGISLVTTVAAIYAGLSLDTRRRRKEMALRKLNGATRKVIAMIFLRTYIWIVAVAAVISLPLCFIGSKEFFEISFYWLDSPNVIAAYILALLLIIAVTAFTIAWKIRDIMHADPIEYLKE